MLDPVFSAALIYGIHGDQFGAAEAFACRCHHIDNRCRGKHTGSLGVGGNGEQTCQVLLLGRLRREDRHGNHPGVQASEERHHVVLIVIQQDQGTLTRREPLL